MTRTATTVRCAGALSPTRRDALISLVASMPFLAGCAGTAGVESNPGRAALLLPLSGPRAGIGRSMQQAAILAQSSIPEVLTLDILDTGGDSTLAGQAAAAAVANGAEVILGPLGSREVGAVLAAAQGVPVITFSNDATLIGSGAFVFGITAAQSVAAIFAHARDTGLKRIAVVAPPGQVGEQAVAAARIIAPQAGLTLTATLIRSSGSAGTLESLRTQSGGDLPDAVLLPDGGASLDEFAQELAGNGMQLLGTSQWSLRALSDIEALRGATFAAPDPEGFARFAQVYRSRHAQAPGVLAGLAYDAVTMAQTLSRSSALNAAGVTRSNGFRGVVGNFRLRADGACLRDLAILTVGENGERVFSPAAAG